MRITSEFSKNNNEMPALRLMDGSHKLEVDGDNNLINAGFKPTKDT